MACLIHVHLRRPGSLEASWGLSRLRSLLDGVGLIFAPLLLMGRESLPAKGQTPVKVATAVDSAPRDGLGELESVQVYGDDVWAHHRCLLLSNASQEGLQPAVEALTCRSGPEDSSQGCAPAEPRPHTHRETQEGKRTFPILPSVREMEASATIVESIETSPEALLPNPLTQPKGGGNFEGKDPDG